MEKYIDIGGAGSLELTLFGKKLEVFGGHLLSEDDHSHWAPRGGGLFNIYLIPWSIPRGHTERILATKTSSQRIPKGIISLLLGHTLAEFSRGQSGWGKQNLCGGLVWCTAS